MSYILEPGEAIADSFPPGDILRDWTAECRAAIEGRTDYRDIFARLLARDLITTNGTPIYVANAIAARADAMVAAERNLFPRPRRSAAA